MGLAASQARFLAITSRKANCEFQSMAIAQEKLSVTREMADATADYQRAINASTLIWDPVGDGTSTYALTYGLMMNPSVLNDFTPYLLTTKDGRVILNSSMAAAAKEISPDGKPVPASLEGYNNFLNALGKSGAISPANKDAALKYGWQKDSGVGGATLDKLTIATMNTGTMADYIEQIMSSTDKDQATKNMKKAFEIDLTANNGCNFEDCGKNNATLTIDGSGMKGGATINLADLLTSDVTIAVSEVGGMDEWKNLVNKIQGCTTQQQMMDVLNGARPVSDGQNEVIAAVGQMIEGFAALLKHDDTLSDSAFTYAVSETLNLLTKQVDRGNRWKPSVSYNDAVKDADKTNGWTYKGTSRGSSDTFNHRALSLSNLAESFLTYFAQAQAGFDGGYCINQESANSSYVTADDSYEFNINLPNGNTKEMFMSEFYSILYNNICSKGWASNEYITDNQYLVNAVKNGQIFISSLNTDGNYYQGPYTDNGYVVETQDDDAIAEAEREFATIKSKLNYKEEKLDVQMKNYDMEISSLTTEYDTVKNLISKNVEKVFTMFST